MILRLQMYSGRNGYLYAVVGNGEIGGEGVNLDAARVLWSATV